MLKISAIDHNEEYWGKITSWYLCNDVYLIMSIFILDIEGITLIILTWWLGCSWSPLILQNTSYRTQLFFYEWGSVCKWDKAKPTPEKLSQRLDMENSLSQWGTPKCSSIRTKFQIQAVQIKPHSKKKVERFWKK